MMESDYGTKLSKKESNWIFRFGKHSGKPMKQVPTNYLEWMLSNVDLSTKEFNATQGTIAGRKGQSKKRSKRNTT